MEFREILQLIKKEYYDFGTFKLPIPNTDFISDQDLYSHYVDILHNALFPNDYNVNYLEGPYEIDELKLKRGDVVIDAGANMGLFTALAGSKGCKVVAFEPDPRPMEYLIRVQALNPSFDIRIISKALSDEENMFDMYLSNYNGGSSITEDMLKQPYFTGKTIKVISTTLDDYVKNYNLESVDFIKADIEGCELQLLEGGRGTIKRFKPKLSICTYHKLGDIILIEELIKDINPNYNIIKRYKKIYAWVD